MAGVRQPPGKGRWSENAGASWSTSAKGSVVQSQPVWRCPRVSDVVLLTPRASLNYRMASTTNSPTASDKVHGSGKTSEIRNKISEESGPLGSICKIQGSPPAPQIQCLFRILSQKSRVGFHSLNHREVEELLRPEETSLHRSPCALRSPTLNPGAGAETLALFIATL